MRSCHCCGLIQSLPAVPRGAVAVCARCGTRLIRASERHADNSLAVAIALSGLILFLPAITLPFLRIEQLGQMRESSLIGAVISLLSHGAWLVAVAVFAAAIVVPPAKLAAMFVLGTIPGRLRSSVRARTLRMVRFLRRWGVVDVVVLLLAVVLAFIRLGDLIQFSAGPGLFAFGLFIVCSLLTAYFFDPYALWDEGPMTEDRNANPAKGENRSAAGEGRDDPGDSTALENPALPTAQTAPARRAPWLWILPIVAVLVVSWLGYRQWQQRGTLITVTFSEGHGLKAGDPLKYRGTVTGRVERVVLSEGLSAVAAEVRLQPGAEILAREGSRFWIVRPEISLTQISGLETLLGANYIAVLPGSTEAEAQYHFIGAEEAPLLDMRESGGINIVLHAADASGLVSGSPVYYRQLRVGGVRDVGLAGDASSVRIDAYIRPTFRELVMADTKFWKSAGVKIEADWSGFSIEMGAAETLLQAGIAMAIPPETAKPVENGHEYVLYEQPQHEWLAWKPALGTGTVPENLPRPTWAILEWTVPGYLYDSVERRAGWVLPADGKLVGPADLLTPPEDAAPESAHLVLAGHRIALPKRPTGDGFEIGQIASPLEGQQVAPVKFREAESPEDVLIAVQPGQGPIFIPAKKLTEGKGYWLVDSTVPMDPSWHGAPTVAVDDGAVIGLVLLHGEHPVIGLFRSKAAGSK